MRWNGSPTRSRSRRRICCSCHELLLAPSMAPDRGHRHGVCAAVHLVSQDPNPVREDQEPPADEAAGGSVDPMEGDMNDIASALQWHGANTPVAVAMLCGAHLAAQDLPASCTWE